MTPQATPPTTQRITPRATPQVTPGGRAFTLMELLISLGLIFLLASLVIVALGGVRAAANRADTISALRQIVQGHSGYTNDNKQRFMPGNVDAAMVNRLGIAPSLATGQTLNAGDSGSYVWRLAPYLNDDWKTFFIDYRSEELLARLVLEFDGDLREPCGGSDPVYGPETAAAAACNDVGISRSPSFGLNSIFVGGDNVHGGGGLTSLNPWDNPSGALAATRYSEVKNPARLIVFGPTEFGDPPAFVDTVSVSDVQFGSPELRPPFLAWAPNADDELEPDPDTLQWKLGDDNTIDPLGEFADGGGVPIARWGASEMPVGHLDGSVVTKNLLDLGADLRSWSPFVVGY